MKQRVCKIFVSIFILACMIFVSEFERKVHADDEFTVNDVTYHILNRDTLEVKTYIGNAEVVDIPETVNGYKVTSIGCGAFDGNQTIKKVVLPKSIQRIEKMAFRSSTLKQIDMPKYIERVEYAAFKDTPLYDNAGDIKYVGNVCLGISEECNLKEIEIRKDTRVIADGAFNDNTYITTIHLPDDLMFIGKEAFADCNNLNTINVPSDAEIGEYAFFNDRKLTHVIFIGDIEYLENSQAFNNTPLQTKKFAKQIAKTTIILFVALICSIEVIVYGKRLLCEKEEN